MIIKRKEIAFIIPSSNIGGAEKQAIILAKELKYQDIANVSIIVFGSNKGEILYLLNKYSLDYYLINTNISFLPNKIFSLYKLFRLYNLLIKSNYDILMPYTLEMNLYVGLIKKKLGQKKIVWNQRDGGFGIIPNRIYKYAFNNFDLYISNSISGLNYLKTNFNHYQTKLHLVYNGYDELDKKIIDLKWKEKYNIKFDEIVICMVANIHKNKDHITVIHSINYLKNILKVSVMPKFVFAGYFGDTYNDIIKLVDKFKLNENIIFCGSVIDIHSIICESDISILSSISEGCSNVVIESMFAAKPIVGTNIYGIKDLLGEDMGDCLFEIGDYIKLSNIINRLICDKELRDNIGKLNYNNAKNKFSIEKLVDNTCNIILK